jgi:hypothetical protein
MPTYYTNLIDEDPNLSTKEWLIKYLSRAMCLTVALRDENPEMTEEQVVKALEESYQQSMEYYVKSLHEGTEKLLKVLKMTDKQWLEDWEEYKDTIAKSNESSMNNAIKTQRRHLKVIAELQQVIDSKETSKVTKDIAQFGIEQLELVKSQRMPYIINPVPLEKYIQNTMESLKQSMEYDKKEIAEHKILLLTVCSTINNSGRN